MWTLNCIILYYHGNVRSAKFFLKKNAHKTDKYMIDWLIDWCFMPTLAIFQLYRGVIKFYYYMYAPTRSLEIKHKTYLFIKQSDNMYK